MSHLSLFPFSNSSGGLNIVSGIEAIASRILHLLLLQKGENPVFPEMGLAPALFIPLSDESVYAFQYEAQQMLTKWDQYFKKKGTGEGIGFEQVWVKSETIDGKIKLRVTFTVNFSDYPASMLFGYQELIDSRSNPQALLNSMQLTV